MADQNIGPIYGSIYDKSSECSPYLAAKVIDGNKSTRSDKWLTCSATNEWVIIDLGRSYAITGFKAWSTYSDDVAYSVKNYRIGLSNTPDSFDIVVTGQIAKPMWFSGNLILFWDISAISSTSARYIKYYLDDNWGHSSGIGTLELEIYSPEIQEETTAFNSNAELYDEASEAIVISNAHIILAEPTTETVQINSDAEITDTRKDVLSDAFIALNTYSDAWIRANERINILSDAMVYRSGSYVRGTFTAGKGSSAGFPEFRNTLVYCTDISASNEVVVADMVVSNPMDMHDIAPPLGYQNYDWKYDWVVRTRNNAQYKFEIRTGETLLDLQASIFSEISLGQIISRHSVDRYHQWRCHVWASGSGDFELHQFSIKGYVDYPANFLYSSFKPKEFTSVSKVETRIDKPYEPMDMSQLWGGTYIPGDLDGDNFITSADLSYMTAYLFGGSPAPIPYRRGDVDALSDSGGAIGFDDLTWLIGYLYLNGPPPRRIGDDFE